MWRTKFHFILLQIPSYLVPSFTASCTKNRDHLHPDFDGITELIEKLKKKSILIALVTGKGEKSCAITLRQFNMDTCFDKVKTGNPTNFAYSWKWKIPELLWNSGIYIVFSSLESGTTRNRTGDTRIFSPLLYQLSYGTIPTGGEFRSDRGAKIRIIFKNPNSASKNHSFSTGLSSAPESEKPDRCLLPERRTPWSNAGKNRIQPKGRYPAT